MLGQRAANRDSFVVTTPSEVEIRMTRLFDGPPALVFEAMTRPEHIRRWWGCLDEGYSVPVCEVDLRVGGRWRFVNRHPGGEAEFYGEYQQVQEPSRLVFTEIFAEFPDTETIVSTEYVEEKGQTRLTVTVRYPTSEVRDMVLATGMSQGAGISYDRLDDLLGTLAGRA